jgi:hypothetical protein
MMWIRCRAKLSNALQIRISRMRAILPWTQRPLLLAFQDQLLRFQHLDAEDVHRVISFTSKEPITLRLLNLLNDGDVFLDVGASNGIYSLPAALRVGSNGLVIAVEADSKKSLRLTQNAQNNSLSNRIVVENCFVASNPDSSARTTTLDEIFRIRDYPAPTFLKLDVDGPELEVLKGFQDGLKAFTCLKILQIEFQETNTELVSLLSELGFRLVAFEFPKARDADVVSGRSMTGNGWFIRTLKPSS